MGGDQQRTKLEKAARNLSSIRSAQLEHIKDEVERAEISLEETTHHLQRIDDSAKSEHCLARQTKILQSYRALCNV